MNEFQILAFAFIAGWITATLIIGAAVEIIKKRQRRRLITYHLQKDNDYLHRKLNFYKWQEELRGE